ncbi:hypothetical protein SPPR111872_02345 [Sphingobacterium prati]
MCVLGGEVFFLKQLWNMLIYRILSKKKKDI